MRPDEAWGRLPTDAFWKTECLCIIVKVTSWQCEKPNIRYYLSTVHEDAQVRGYEGMKETSSQGMVYVESEREKRVPEGRKEIDHDVITGKDVDDNFNWPYQEDVVDYKEFQGSVVQSNLIKISDCRTSTGSSFEFGQLSSKTQNRQRKSTSCASR